MKIVQINTECERGSTGRIVSEISDTLNGMGIENYIFYSGNHHSSRPNAFQVNSKFKLRIDQAFTTVFGSAGLHSTIETKSLVKKLKDIKPDIIHLHNIHGYYIDIRVLFDYLNQFEGKIVWTLHDCWALTGRCAHYEFIKCRKWQTGCNNCQRMNKYPASLFLDRSSYLWRTKKRLFENCTDMVVVAPSYWMKSQVEKSFLSKYKCIVINNGVDPEQFYYTKENYLQENYRLHDKIIVLGVSSIWGDPKGLPDYIKLAGVLPDKYRVVLVGTNNSVDKLLPQNIISIHRTTSVEELRKIYCSADVFVNLTKEDTYPTVNIEAVACGTPVISYRNCGSAEIAGENDGIIVDSFDELVSVIENSTFTKKNAEREKISKERCYKQYVELYKSGR